MEFNTRLLHGGFGADKATGATLAPIYQVSAFAQESAEKLEAVFNNRAPGDSRIPGSAIRRWRRLKRE